MIIINYPTGDFIPDEEGFLYLEYQKGFIYWIDSGLVLDKNIKLNRKSFIVWSFDSDEGWLGRSISIMNTIGYELELGKVKYSLCTVSDEFRPSHNDNLFDLKEYLDLFLQ